MLTCRLGLLAISAWLLYLRSSARALAINRLRIHDGKSRSRSFKLEARYSHFDHALDESVNIQNSKLGVGAFVNITNEVDLQYLAKVSVAGQVLSLAVDTGSSDLWVHTSDALNVTHLTSIPLTLIYGIGSASGTISYGPVEIGDFKIPAQAFLNVDEVVQQDGQGILGLGLASLSSIYRTSQEKESSLPPMYTLFHQNDSAFPFFGLSIERSDDKECTAGGVLSISEYEPRFSSIENSSVIPLSPAQTTRWTLALEHAQINGQAIPLTSKVMGASSNTSIALIDSGTSLAYIPPTVVDLIYENIPGSVNLQLNGESTWLVPCMQPANLSFTFGGQSFPINPLELTTLQMITVDGQQWTVCANAFKPQLAVGSADLDFLLGDIFMRNVYSIFNFGDISSPKNATSASMQFLSRTDPSEAYSNFYLQRGINLSLRSPLFDLSSVKQLLGGDD